MQVRLADPSTEQNAIDAPSRFVYHRPSNCVSQLFRTQNLNTISVPNHALPVCWLCHTPGPHADLSTLGVVLRCEMDLADNFLPLAAELETRVLVPESLDVGIGNSHTA